MITVTDKELQQRTSEYISYIRDYAVNAKKDFKIYGNHGEFELSLFEKDVTLEFSL